MSKRMFSILAVSLLALVSVAPAEWYVWDGGGDDVSWDDPDNWDPTGVPNGSDDSATVVDPTPSYADQYLSPVVDLEDVTVNKFCGPACGQCDVNQVMTIDGVTFTITSAEQEDNWVRDGDFGDSDPERSYWEIRLINGGRLELPNGGARLHDHGVGRISLEDDSSFYVNGQFRAADEDDGYMWIVTTGTSDINITEDCFFGDDGGGCFDFGGNSTITIGDWFGIPGREEEILGMKNLINVRDSAVLNAAGVGVHASKEGEVTMNVYGGTVNAGFLRAGCKVCKDESPEGTGDIFVYDGIVNISGDISIPDSEDTTATLTQEGGTISCCTLIVKEKGRVDLNGGTLEVTCDGSIDCGGGMINIAGGTLVLPGNQCGNIPECMGGYYVDLGGGCAGFKGELVCDYDPIEDKTTVTSLPPNDWKAWSPSPSDGAIWQSVDVVLCWCRGDCLLKHAVYLSDNFNDVNDGTPVKPCFMGYRNPGHETFDPAIYPPPSPIIELWKTYYWRVDEHHKKTLPGCSAAPMLTKGDVWSFTTGCELIDGDINLDCVVNFLDYAMLADDWRECVFFPDDVTP